MIIDPALADASPLRTAVRDTLRADETKAVRRLADEAALPPDTVALDAHYGSTNQWTDIPGITIGRAISVTAIGNYGDSLLSCGLSYRVPETA